MNMKKVFAGALASIIAISAMATVVSAKNAQAPATADQAESTKTWDFTGKKYTVTWTGEALKGMAGTYEKTSDAADDLTFTFGEAVDSATIKLTGQITVGTTKSTDTKTINLKKVDNSADKKFSLKLQAGASTTTDGVFPTKYFDDGVVIAQISYTIKKDFQKKEGDDGAKKAAEAVKNITVEAGGTGAAKSLAADIMAAFPAGTAIAGGEGKVADGEVEHGPKIGDTTKSKYGTLYELSQGSGLVYATRYDKDEKIIDADSVTSGIQLDGDTAKFETALTNVKLGNLMLAIQNEIGDAKGATLTFNLNTDKKDDEKTPDSIGSGTVAPVSNNTDAENFAIAVNYTASTKFTKGQKVADDATKIVFNWDDIAGGLAAGQMYNSAIRVADGKTFQIDSVVVDVPAKSLSDLSAGEAAEETTAALVEAPATEAPAETEAAANPTTGNAPIALAVIPVAIVAAAVIAKKRG